MRWRRSPPTPRPRAPPAALAIVGLLLLARPCRAADTNAVYDFNNAADFTPVKDSNAAIFSTVEMGSGDRNFSFVGKQTTYDIFGVALYAVGDTSTSIAFGQIPAGQAGSSAAPAFVGAANTIPMNVTYDSGKRQGFVSVNLQSVAASKPNTPLYFAVLWRPPATSSSATIATTAAPTATSNGKHDKSRLVYRDISATSIFGFSASRAFAVTTSPFNSDTFNSLTKNTELQNSDPVVNESTPSSASGTTTGGITATVDAPGAAATGSNGASTSSTVTAGSPSSVKSSAKSGSGHKLSTGAIVGIAVAAVAVAAILMSLVTWLCLRRRDSSRRRGYHDASSSMGGSPTDAVSKPMMDVGDGALGSMPLRANSPYAAGGGGLARDEDALSRSHGSRGHGAGSALAAGLMHSGAHHDPDVVSMKEAGGVGRVGTGQSSQDMSPSSPYSDDSRRPPGTASSLLGRASARATSLFGRSNSPGAQAAPQDAGAAAAASGAAAGAHHDDPPPYPPYEDAPSLSPTIAENRSLSGAGSPPPGSHDRAGTATPQAISSRYAHLVEEGMTEDQIRQLEEEERQLDAAIERAGQR